MAVNSIVFGGVDSADYGIYISGEGVFDAPKRDVEMIEIPGRNGAFALDNGRFENIEVTYPAFNFEPNDYETFAQNLSDFRNALCSQKGYQRLTDSFHPDEYRMAVYKDGLDVKPVKYNTASEFNIVFDCKPQRWLTSGETAVSVESGDELTNPTLFESSPLLEVEGYGNIQFNGYEIELADTTLGVIELVTSPATEIETVFDENKVNAGDALFYAGRFEPSFSTRILRNSTDVTITDVVGWGNTNCTSGFHFNYPISCTDTIYPNLSAGFIVGTASTISWQAKCKVTYEKEGTSSTWIVTTDGSLSYDGLNKITLSNVITAPANSDISATFTGGNPRTLSADSSVGSLGHPTYIDCDLGEAYMIKDGSVISLNQYIDLGSDLPVLASGTNEIVFDNTITDLKVVPRWWKI